MTHYRFLLRICLPLLCISILLGSISACDRFTGNTPPADSTDSFGSEADTDLDIDLPADIEFQNGYALLYTSNGDGTCTVRIVTDPTHTELFDVSIPHTSPEGDTVVAIADDQFTSNVPYIMSKESFTEKIIKPLEAYFGITYEDARANHNSSKNAFYLCSCLAYFKLFSQDEYTNESMKQDMLAEWPLAAYTDIYGIDRTIGPEGYLKLSNTFAKAGISTSHVAYGYAELDTLSGQPAGTTAAAYHPTFRAYASSGYFIQSVTLPETIQTIGSYAFFGCANLTEIKIPDSVTDIRDYAFSHCIQLSDVSLPSGLASIGSSAFSECAGIVNLDLPDGVTSIGASAFSGCNALQAITIPNNLTVLEAFTFSKCTALTSILIPENMTRIAQSAFSQCTLDITVDPANSAYSVDNNCLIENATKTVLFGIGNTIPQGIKAIGDDAYHSTIRSSSPGGESVFLIIPDTVQSIGDRAFAFCTSVTDIQIPDSISILPAEVFFHCDKLASITLPNSITHIEAYAFEYCYDLNDIAFNGTMDEWNQIDKADHWFSKRGQSITIHCTDGDIASTP